MPTPKPNETKDDFLSRCMGYPDMQKYEPDQRYAVCQSKWDEMESQFVESYTDYPQGAVNNAKKALAWVEKHGWGTCGEATGKARANQLANNEPISRDTIARMAAFKRHQQHKDVPYSEGCGGLMWDAWGGDAGINWASRKLKEIDSKKSNFADAKISFDYDGVLSTDKGKALVETKIKEGNTVYIISARNNKDSMLGTAQKLGIPESRIYATGSNQAKVQKIKDLGINTHYDNNPDVINQLKEIGTLYV